MIDLRQPSLLKEVDSRTITTTYGMSNQIDETQYYNDIDVLRKATLFEKICGCCIRLGLKTKDINEIQDFIQNRLDDNRDS